ncbi:MAG: zf-HC2 domain-containing protein [Chloroflexota bacterium]|nr:zf-HC2 domain-containing protein [Chloroflexota bacterium]
MRYTCRHCRAELTAYIHRQLSPQRRQRVGRHLNACANCYTLYRQLRDVDRELQTSLPLLGQPGRRQLSGMWQGIQTQISAPRRTVPVFRVRYGVAVMLAVMALALPWSFNRAPAYALPLPPTPVHTVRITNAPDAIAMATADAPTVGFVPTPTLEANDAPDVSATETP